MCNQSLFYFLNTIQGDGTLFAYEMSSTPSHINALSHCRFDSLHQAISFLPKIVCNISEVEFARAWRLTPTHVEPVSFTVPRVKVKFYVVYFKKLFCIVAVSFAN